MNTKNFLCRVGVHYWHKVVRVVGFTWFFGNQYLDTGRRICKKCKKEKRVAVEYAMMEGDIG